MYMHYIMNDEDEGFFITYFAWSLHCLRTNESVWMVPGTYDMEGEAL